MVLTCKLTLGELFRPIEHVSECLICHRDDQEPASKIRVKSLENTGVCRSCEELIYLGARLPDAACNDQGRAQELHIQQSDTGTGCSWDPSGESFLPCAYEIKQPKPERDSFVLHNFDLFRPPKLFWSLREYADNEFTTLANASTGVKRVAVLRADVDNLGKIFSGQGAGTGLSAALRSLSRDAAVSRALARFFTHYLDDLLCSQNARDGRSEEWAITTVYSGGDDLFLVGAWDQILEFALLLNEKFQSYTCNKLAISAGVSIHKPKYPLYRMAQDSADAERAAKMGGKDRLCVRFDDRIFEGSHIFTWKEWQTDILPLLNQINELKLNDGLSSAFWNYLLSYVRTGDQSFYHLLYNTARLEERTKGLRISEQWQEFKQNWLMPLGTSHGQEEAKRILESVLNWHLLLARGEMRAAREPAQVR